MTPPRAVPAKEALAQIRAMAVEIASRGEPVPPRPDSLLPNLERVREEDEQQRRVRGGFGWLARELTPEQLEAEMERRRARARAKYGIDGGPPRAGEGGGL